MGRVGLSSIYMIWYQTSPTLPHWAQESHSRQTISWLITPPHVPPACWRPTGDLIPTHLPGRGPATAQLQLPWDGESIGGHGWAGARMPFTLFISAKLQQNLCRGLPESKKWPWPRKRSLLQVIVLRVRWGDGYWFWLLWVAGCLQTAVISD